MVRMPRMLLKCLTWICFVATLSIKMSYWIPWLQWRYYLGMGSLVYKDRSAMDDAGTMKFGPDLGKIGAKKLYCSFFYFILNIFFKLWRFIYIFVKNSTRFPAFLHKNRYLKIFKITKNGTNFRSPPCLNFNHCRTFL